MSALRFTLKVWLGNNFKTQQFTGDICQTQQFAEEHLNFSVKKEMIAFYYAEATIARKNLMTYLWVFSTKKYLKFLGL